MAPPSTLKQSPIDDYFLHSPTPTNSAASGSDYELIRRDTIRRNQDFLQKLGISVAAPKPKPPPRRVSKTPTTPNSHRLPLRRSSRHKAPPPPSTDDSVVTAENSPVKPPSFVDSSVFQYACDETSGTACAVRSSPSSPIVGFNVVGKPFRDPSLNKIYSIDVSFLKRDRFLLAAAGHGGFISVYGEDDCAEEVPGGGSIEPLMSWKGFSSWVSGVKFLKANPFLLVSSSNDGSVVIWDVKKQAVSTRDRLPGQPPAVVAKSTKLHSGGIFGMDQLDCWIATCSKDSSVGISRLTPEGQLVAEQTFSGHHSGVIRGVSFGDTKHHIADCSADGKICILDARSGRPCMLTIEAQHSTGVNTIEWSKSNSNLILSGSKDPILRVHDIRSLAEPVNSELQGHVESNTGSPCYQIYRPCFVGQNIIATPGQGSRKISLFDVATRAMISQGRIGYDANLVLFTGNAEDPRLWAAGRQINQLCPLQEPTIDSQMFL